MGEKNERSLKRMQADLARQASAAERKARKDAGKLRRDFVRGKSSDRGAVTEDNWEELLDAYGPSKRRRLSEIISDLAPGATGDVEGQEVAGSESAMVMSATGNRARIFAAGAEVDALIPPHIAMRRGSALVAGDRVQLAEEDGIVRVETVLPRRSILARPDPINRHLQRMIAANIDVVVNVVSVKSPPLRPRLIDRVLIAIERGGAQPVICVNKIDLLEPAARAEELARLDPYRALEVPVIACSTRSGEGLEELRAICERRTSALVGHSGVGKSSILNALDERLALATRTLHRRGTGRHTTTRATLYDFGDETFIIDTPGIREFGLWDLDRDALRDYFPEFRDPAESCRFTDCTHVHEPDCEVKRLVEEGELNEPRYETYVRLYDALPDARR